MAIIEVEINSKIYQIGCEPEDEVKIKEYIAILNSRIEEFKSQDPVFFMGLNDERIFLFNALTLIADNLEMKHEIKQHKKYNSDHKRQTLSKDNSINDNVQLSQDLDIIYSKAVTINDNIAKMSHQNKK